MKIIVFGGSGFLGSHVCDKLDDAGHEVTIFDRHRSAYLRESQTMIEGDILDERAVADAVSGQDVVFNFAGIADIDEARKRPVDSIRYNILGNGIVLEAARVAQVQRFVFASSAYVYSKSGAFYRCSKQACESYVETYHDVFGLEFTILRYGSLYGPRADDRNAIFRFVQSALQEGRMVYAGDPEAIREYIHVEDAASCSVEILKSEYANLHVMLTGHQPMKVKDLFHMINEMLPDPVETFFERSPDAIHYRVTPYSFNPRMGRKLAPSFHIDLGQGVLRIIEEVYKRVHPDLHEAGGYIVDTDRV